MFTLIKQADVYTPENIGIKDILMAGGKIAAIEDEIEVPASWGEVRTVNAAGRPAVPGLIDAHVHITGGGGEGGFRTRTPELTLSDAVQGGVTTVVGVIGTDGTTRTMDNLVAKARSLTEEGITCYCLTGNYHVPVKTLTGAVEDDILHIDPIIGAGEIAIADHRSSQPTVNELAKVASASRIGGMLSGKGGSVTVHVGDGKDQLDVLEETVSTTNLPITQFVPTHLNRSHDLFERAVTYAKNGGYVDFTTSTVPNAADEDELTCPKALESLLNQNISITQISFTSDAQGSLPAFDEQGNFTGLDVGRVTSLFDAVRQCVQEKGIPLETAIQTITTTPAKAQQLREKGRIAKGFDGDLVLLDQDLTIQTVIAKGDVLMEEQTLLRTGTFE
ncbi:beta-aspartyl-dipeptidase (metallo-type) [Salsuginibacillus halophilus]|uniref:Isoaspartyl dipeptidase n=1 Tax=Salsuginibacillus halophilus TaxID=517424 RepID=A0A2P8HYQ4_9BACI|nr:beta-aspartyl-peptidase [Salsuginibacillus halophilus]PSL51368.1 beta-aspartyl-dipeptidase (metallo-type) [Salsuginibacillus halophilus]